MDKESAFMEQDGWTDLKTKDMDPLIEAEVQNSGEWTTPGKGKNKDCSSIDILITPQPGEIEIRRSPKCTCKEEEAGYCEKDEQEEWVVQEVEDYVIKSFQHNVEEVEKAFGNSFHRTFGRALQGNSAKVTVGLDIAMRVSVERETTGGTLEKSPTPDSPEGREFSSIDYVACSPKEDSDESEDESQWGPVLVEEEADGACPWREGPIYQGQTGINGVIPGIPETEEERYELRLKRLLRKPSMKWTTKIEPRLKEFLRNPDGKLSSYLEGVMQKEDCTEEKGEPGS